MLIDDTQTGLRGYPINMLMWLVNIEGSRYEYEMNMLLRAKGAGYSFCTIPIETIYEKNNVCSHFNPIWDSIHVCIPILKFNLSSIVSSDIDFIFLMLFNEITKNLLFSVVMARVFSSILNYTLNQKIVFEKNNLKPLNSSIRYFILVIVVLVCNYSWIYTFTKLLTLPLVLSKILTEALLFFVSYSIKKRYVFK